MTPRATFGYDESTDAYLIDTINKAMALLSPMHSRIRAKGVDSSVNKALSALEEAKARLLFKA